MPSLFCWARSDARSTLFLDLFATVLDAWQARLAQEQALDFDDMLNRAAKLIEAGDWVSPYTVVAVDEWQDTSRARARIVRALTRQGVSLAAIGDDYQSIYRFAGSDIRLMTQFQSLMGPATTRYLTQTFRCPQHLSDVATAFVQQNPAQIAKTVLSHNPMEGRSIRCVAYSQNREDALESLLGQLRDHARRRGETYSVYLLGRYRHDCPSTLRHLQATCRPVLSLRFATIHQAKGLEADYVFLLGANAGKAGFPSRIRVDALLDLVMPPQEEFPDAEERRLLYVALTRAKRRVIILADQRNPSAFVMELERHGAGPMTTLDGEPAASPCPACREGVMVPRTSKYGPFLGCSTYPRCRHTSQLETA